MREILAGLDDSARAANVLDVAMDMASAFGAKLALIRAVSLPPDIPQDLWKTTDLTLLEILQQRARESLCASEARIPPEMRGGIHVVVGTPWQAVCETARAVHADLVVVGCHGYSGVDRILGTTAAKVVNHTPCSVVVVRAASSEARSAFAQPEGGSGA